MADQAGLNSPRSPPTQPTQPPQLLDLDGIAKELEAVNERRVASAQAQAIIDQNQAADRQSYAYITGQLAQGFNVSVPVPNSPPHDMSAIKDVETNSEFTRLASRVGALSAKVDNLVPRFQAA